MMDLRHAGGVTLAEKMHGSKHVDISFPFLQSI